MFTPRRSQLATVSTGTPGALISNLVEDGGAYSKGALNRGGWWGGGGGGVFLIFGAGGGAISGGGGGGGER